MRKVFFSELRAVLDARTTSEDKMTKEDAYEVLTESLCKTKKGKYVILHDVHVDDFYVEADAPEDLLPLA